VNIPIGIVGFILIATTLGPLRPELVRKFDLVGAGLLTGWVAAVMFPLYQIVDAGWGWTDPRVLVLLGLGAVLIIAFVFWELRQNNPLVPLRLLARRVMAAGGGATYFIGMVFFPVATFLSLVVGLALAPGNPNIVRDILYYLVIPLVIGAALGGQLLTQLSYRAVAVAGLVIGIIGMASLTTLSVTTPIWILVFGFIPVGGVVLPLVPLGFGIGMTFPVFLLAAQNQVGTADVGEAGGFIQFLQSLGGAVGLSVLASFQATRWAALGASPSALLTSYDQTFAVMVGLLVVALVFVLFLVGHIPKTGPKKLAAASGPAQDAVEAAPAPVSPP
jgi:MFS family permease